MSAISLLNARTAVETKRIIAGKASGKTFQGYVIAEQLLLIRDLIQRIQFSSNINTFIGLRVRLLQILISRQKTIIWENTGEKTMALVEEKLPGVSKGDLERTEYI